MPNILQKVINLWVSASIFNNAKGIFELFLDSRDILDVVSQDSCENLNNLGILSI